METLCFAGHDAGNVALHHPAAMVLVRNPTGISLSPQEHVSLEDAAAGVSRILAVLEQLA
jgi:N-carbamoyl-L-amino-acid hydrolase